VTDPNIRGGRVIFNTLIPNTTICAYGGAGWVMEVDVNTGNRLVRPTFDINADRILNNSDYITYGTGTNNTSGRYITSIPAQAGFMRPPQAAGTSPFENKYLNTSSGNVSIVGETSGSGIQGRILWQQIP
jgi:type IV pilus assembly protein PilY1